MPSVWAPSRAVAFAESSTAGRGLTILPDIVASLVSSGLAAVFFAAAVLKLRSQEESRRFLHRLGVPRRGSTSTVWIIIGMELGLGVVLLVSPVLGGALACGLYFGFALLHLRHGSGPEGCGCFGVRVAPAAPGLWRGVVLRLIGAVAGGFVAASGVETHLSSVWWLSVGSGLVLVLWFRKRAPYRPGTAATGGFSTTSGTQGLGSFPSGAWSRRTFLIRAVLATGAVVTSPLLLGISSRTPSAAAAAVCPLFRAASSKCNY